MVSLEKKLANAMGGKTARACDSCITNRAQWYCEADDAFLCRYCDALVHSSNPLARSHERTRLNTWPEIQEPSWHHGFTKKSRTPRAKNSNKSGSNRMPSSDPLHLVPEIESDDLNTMDSGDQLPFQVPVFDPFSSELCFNGLVLPSDMELAEFAADVESLLNDSWRVKEEEEQSESESEMMTKPISFDYGVGLEAEDDQKVAMVDEKCVLDTEKDDKIKKMLKLDDYEGIIAAWDDDRSPWATGNRPELDSDDCWHDCMVMHYDCEDKGMMIRNSTRLDGAREARVSRYREKRRTRLFSKKIRYEVRKLNAEKRPRMKGRFVKRASFAATSLLST